MDTDNLKSSVDNYQPNQDILVGIRDLKVLATVGPSASGKTTAAKALVGASPDFYFVLGETSRSVREAELPGVDYLFRSREEIISDLKRGTLVDVILGANGDLYSTRLSSYSKNATGIIALMPPAVNKYRQLPLKFFKAAFIVPKSYEDWLGWLSARREEGQWNEKQYGQRLKEAKKSYEFALSDPQIAFVLNDNASNAAERLSQVASGQEPNDQAQARDITQINYKKLTNQI